MSKTDEKQNTDVFWIVKELDYEVLSDDLAICGDYELYEGDGGDYSGDYCYECASEAVKVLDALHPEMKFGTRYDTNPEEPSSCCECHRLLNDYLEEEE